MNKAELLAELETYFIAREPDKLLRSFGITEEIKVFETVGAVARTDDRADEITVIFYVYEEGKAGETAYYAGDPINIIWSKHVEDYINSTNKWAGRIVKAQKPKATCYVIEDPAVGEKLVMITEISKDTYTKEDIAGSLTAEL